MKIFLGGTSSKDWSMDWRPEFIKTLNDDLDYFNPIVKDWNEAAKQNEILQRKVCDTLLYVITPCMTGVYSIAEITEDCITKTGKVVIVVLSDYKDKQFDEHQTSSIESCMSLWKKYTEHVYTDLSSVAQMLNERFEESKLLRNW